MNYFQDIISLSDLFEKIDVNILIRLCVYGVLSFVILKLFHLLIKKMIRSSVSLQTMMLIQKSFKYAWGIIFILIILREFQIDFTAILGAAGIVGVAFGVASRNSLGNLISGLFLIGEKPFEIGDVISIEDKKGVVHSIDTLSIKLRTFDNLYVRIPNEKIINTDVINITRFPIRRMDLDISVTYAEDLEKVMSVLKDITLQNRFCLNEPEALILLKGFYASSIDVLLGVWFEKSNFIQLKNSLVLDVKKRFDAEGIEFAFPHVSVYTGTHTAPFPLTLEKELKN